MNEKFNYNFCKYSYGKKEFDFDRCYKCEKTCPSVSNLLWTIPIINQINSLYHKISWNFEAKKYEKDSINEYETKSTKHIWGIKSWDDLTGSDCNLYTMNDIDLIYCKDTDDYVISIETIYDFRSENGDKKYLQEILGAFTQWMNNNGYQTNHNLLLHEIFTKGYNINTHFKTIEECYANFKLLVNGYCNA
jgi:hypothetical protein